MRLLTEIIIGILVPAAVVWLALKIGVMNVILISVLVWVVVKTAHWWLEREEIRGKERDISIFLNEKFN
jgi:hypothetical protein